MQVKYEDGDEEEVDWAELSQLIAAAEKQTPKKQKGTPAKAPAAKRSKVAAGEGGDLIRIHFVTRPVYNSVHLCAFMCIYGHS